MTAVKELYKCEICGNVVEVVHEGAPALVCCEQPMKKLEAKTAQEEGKEKHVPVLESADGGTLVKVGSVQHPMEENHYIKFIEIITKEKVMRVDLKPGDVPEAKCCASKEDIIEVREYCTVHDLWKA